MKIITVLFLALAAFGPPAAAQKLEDLKKDPLLAALWEKESGRGVRVAKGDNGKALGPLQIWRAAVLDVNRAYSTRYTHADMLREDRAFRVCHLYLELYAGKYERVTGLKAGSEVRARIWNGGPEGWKKQSTLSYWRDVAAIMKGDNGKLKK